MPTKSKSILFSAKVDPKVLQVKISPETFDALQALDLRLERLGGRMTFNRSQIVEKALVHAIGKANAELDRLPSKAPEAVRRIDGS